MIFFKPTVNETDSAKIEFKALENDICLGCCTLILKEKTAEVTEVSLADNDLVIAEGLLRSAYNYASLKSYYLCSCSALNIAPVLKKMGFENKEGIYISDIPSALMGGCCK